ncbi:hypothetical protein BJX65DRAFT_267920 [Aspergillus insuetus]
MLMLTATPLPPPPLHLAVTNSHPAAMDNLLTRGADPFRLCIYGRSAVDWILLYAHYALLPRTSQTSKHRPDPGNQHTL